MPLPHCYVDDGQLLQQHVAAAVDDGYDDSVIVAVVVVGVDAFVADGRPLFASRMMVSDGRWASCIQLRQLLLPLPERLGNVLKSWRPSHPYGNCNCFVDVVAVAAAVAVVAVAGVVDDVATSCLSFDSMLLLPHMMMIVDVAGVAVVVVGFVVNHDVMNVADYVASDFVDVAYDIFHQGTSYWRHKYRELLQRQHTAVAADA